MFSINNLGSLRTTATGPKSREIENFFTIDHPVECLARTAAPCSCSPSRLGSGMTRRAIYSVFEDAAFQGGIDAGRRNIRICKHSLAVNLRKRGVSVDIVQRALDHADPATTLRYYYHTSQDEAIQSVFAAV